MAYNNSPQMTQYSFEGIHLAPNHSFAYNQRTYTHDGIELESWTAVYIVDLCGKRIKNITSAFDVIENFQDPEAGLPQIIWQLKTVDFDAGYQPVYLEIVTGLNTSIFSSPFYLTNNSVEYSSHWFYKNRGSETILSIGLVLFFKHKKSDQEISNYTAVSTGRMFTASSRITPFERWHTGVIEINVLEEFKTLFNCRYVYSLPQNFDGLPVRTGLYEAIETPDTEADENFTEQEILLVRNYSQTFDPNAVPIVPPAPPVEVPEIILQVVSSLNADQVQFQFTYDNFQVEPTNFTYQYSLDGVSYISNTLGTANLQTVYAPNNIANNYYYRIFHQATGTYSNVYQMPAQSINLYAVTSMDGAFDPVGNKYLLYFTANGFTPASSFIGEVSTDNVTWQQATITSGTTSPRVMVTNSLVSPVEFKYFRLKYNPLSLISNSKFHQF